MLSHADLVAFVPTRNPQNSRRFYEKTLGLEFVSEDPFAIVFNANGVTLRVTNVSTVPEFKPAPFAILGWRVPDVASTVREMGTRGVKFQRFPGMSQDELGIWTAPSGARIAWFPDPDGNVLSVTQH